ncbi:MAG: D-alanyl-D-alanine carboxypeptidase [Nocardioidaceae bacterium]|nr:D-alanyl-D-alanine carboxypeptidase [Nocardioidaceae bacterium]
MTVTELMTPFLKLSNNMHAEALVKTMGAETVGEGSWDAGFEQLHAFRSGAGRRRGSDPAGRRVGAVPQGPGHRCCGHRPADQRARRVLVRHL